MLTPLVAKPPIALYKAAGTFLTSKISVVIHGPSPVAGRPPRASVTKRVMLWSASAMSVASNSSPYSAAAAGGLALINSLGQIAGFVSPFLVGWIKDATGSTDIALYVLSAVLLLGAVLVMVVPARLVNR